MLKILGICDDVNSCDCCGRQNLKATVAFENATGDVIHMGMTCASHALKRTSKEIKQEIEALEAIEQEKKEKARKEESKRWFAFLQRNAPHKKEAFEQIEALGGIKKTRELYNQQNKAL